MKNVLNVAVARKTVSKRNKALGKRTVSSKHAANRRIQERGFEKISAFINRALPAEPAPVAAESVVPSEVVTPDAIDKVDVSG